MSRRAEREAERIARDDEAFKRKDAAAHQVQATPIPLFPVEDE
jgi:hypothetical protein